MLSLKVGQGIWLYELQSHRAVPVNKPHPSVQIDDVAWAEDGTLYVRATRYPHAPKDPPIYWAATMTHVQEDAEPPAEILQAVERERAITFGLNKPKNARYTVWVEHRAHGSASLRVSLKSHKGVRILADGSWELDSFIFDAERSTVLYPVSHARLYDTADGKTIVERLGGEIIVADLRTLGKRSLVLPNGGNLRLLDQTRDAHRIAYLVSGSCLASDSENNVPANVCFADR